MKLRRCLYLLAVLGTIVWSQSAFASHFRYGNISWTKDTVNPQLIHFTVQQAWRSTLLDCFELNFGDGATSNACGGATTIGTGVDTNGQAYTVRQYTTQHIYLLPGEYLAFFEGCCRVAGLQNATSNDPFRVESVVSVRLGNTGGPQSNAPAIISLQTGGIRTYVFPMSDPDLDPVTCRLANPGETGLTNPTPTIPGALMAQPTLTTTAAGCQLQWNTTNAVAGQQYVVHYVVESIHSGFTSSTQVDLIVQMISTPPPTCAGSGTFIVPVGQAFSTMVTGTNNVAGNLVFGATGAPAGSTFTPASGTTQMSPFSTTFAFTPTMANFGQTYNVLANFTNTQNATGTCTIVVQVPLCNQSGQNCTAGVGACQTSGQQVCTGPGTSMCNAVAGMPTPEVCGNMVDENCNGALNDGCVDTDMDGIFDPIEILIGTNPNDADSDDDGVPDGQEPSVGIDTDGDGLINGLDPDSDNDGLYDGTELGLGCGNPATDLTAGHCTPDGDMGATTTNPLDADTDDGGVIDGSEDANLNGVLDAGETDPTAGHGADDATVTDTDGDGLSDDLEVFIHSNPNDADSDDDGIIDGDEANYADDTDGDGLINVLDVDSDDDGLYDGTEVGNDCANPATNAAAGHCVADGDTGTTTTSMVDPDTDNGGAKDGSEDANHNGVKDPTEQDPTTGHGGDDAAVTDTDGDGLSNEEEMAIGTNPMDADSDDDGIIDGLEANYADDTDGDNVINALDADSDGDGLLDGTETGTDCTNPATNVAMNNCVVDADNTTVTSMVNPDTDFGGVPDGTEDTNHNGSVDGTRKDPLDPSDDDPCVVDADCGGLTSGIVCDADIATCVPGCRGVGGNGCPMGEECTSMDMTIGDCVPVMATSSSSGSMSSGSMSSGSMSSGNSMTSGSMSSGNSMSSGTGAGGGDTGGAGAYVQGHGIFGCAVSTSPTNRSEADDDSSGDLAFLGLAVLGLTAIARKRGSRKAA